MRTFRHIKLYWTRSLRVGPTLLLIALLPSLTYLGHWGNILSHSVNDDDRASLSGRVVAAAALNEGPSSIGIGEHRHGPNNRATVAPQPKHEESRRSSSHDHASHCHMNVATCSERPVPTDLRMLHVVVELTHVELTETAQAEPTMSAEAFVSAVPTDPPRGQARNA